MDKRKLSALPRKEATPDMLDIAGRLSGMSHIVTAELVGDSKILLLYFYEIATLSKGKTEAAFRTFLSEDDYITQDLKTQKVRWKTASFAMMDNFYMWDSTWNDKEKKLEYRERLFIRTNKEKELISDFFKDYDTKEDEGSVWRRINNFQDVVKEKRLEAKHKKETDVIDMAMEPFGEVPQEFYDWVWETGMGFSRYLVYKENKKGKADCMCTYCGKTGVVDRKEMRLRNNEKGCCPFCKSPVIFKAKGKIGNHITDRRWFIYVDPVKKGFCLRYFYAFREISNGDLIGGLSVKQHISEYCRAIYTFQNGNPMVEAYEWTLYKQTGKTRWCYSAGKILCGECILYPGNLPQAWAHTPMKYSALEILSGNMPTVAMYYERGIRVYLKFPKLEWLCKMGLNNLAESAINGNFDRRSVAKFNYGGSTIYEILGLSKVNTRILQKVDGNEFELRLLQVAQQIGLQFTAEQLKEYYETFECNTELLKKTRRKVSLHKLVKYITRESENYPIGDMRCSKYSYNCYREREDPRILRKRNTAHDWLEYLEWCRKMKYDLNNAFVYMPKNFKKVHDRTAKEYQEFQDKKEAAEKLRREEAARRTMEETKKALQEILSQSDGLDAFSIKGKGLVLVVPKNGDEIRAEGTALHHCVGGYVEKVAKGETSIFFIRKVEEPDKPYFTMEWKNNDIAQCKGLHNCAMPPEVKAFTQAFKEKMLEVIEKGGESPKMRRCG